MNPIKYSELIQNDVGNEFEVLAKTLKTIKGNYDGLAKSVNDQTARLAEGLKALNPATPEGQAALIAYARQVEELEKKVKTLEAALKNYKQTQKELNDLDAVAIRRKIEHREKVREVTNMVKEYAAEQKLTEKVIDELSRKEELQKMSYNQLSQAYSRLKDQINEMTAATEDEIKAREKLSATARGVYEQMGKLQQATGKYTLSVGNYAKSWNGLNIAMQQIIRETPNMAMGFNTFFLAISNNIPILTDQIKLAQDKYKADLETIESMKKAGESINDIRDKEKELIPVGKQLLSSILSWQTVLLAGVTLLTMFGGKLIEQIKLWNKNRKGIDEAKVSLEAYNNALNDSSSKAAEASAKLDLLYREATDLNASMEDRLGAIKDLKALYPDIFDGLENEAILAGNAKEQYDLLSGSIYKAAQAEAAFSKLAEIAGKEIDLKLQKQQLNQLAVEGGYLGVNDMAQFYGSFIDENADENPIRKATLTKEQRNAVKTYQDAEKELEKLRIDREAYIKMMEDYNLFGYQNGNDGKKGASSKGEQVGDYYWDAVNAFIEARYEGSVQELLKMRSTHSQLMEELKAEEEDLIRISRGDDKDLAAQAEEQLENIRSRMFNEQIKYENQVQDFISGILQTYEEEVTDENNLLDIAKKRMEAELKVEKELMTSEMYMLFEQKKITQEELNEKLARINNDYWYAYAQQLKSMGDIQGYNAAMGNIKEGGNAEDEDNPIAKWMKKWVGDKKFIKDLEKAAKLTIGYIGDIIDAYHELAQAAVEAAEKQVDAAQKVYEAELGAYENGYANNVEFARKELALRKEQLAKAAEQEKKYAKMQQAAESAEQAVTLASTIAYLFRDAAKGEGLLGVPLAIAASTAMLAAFTASKVMVAKATKAKDAIEYGEGMHEYLDYGGSHASGNDIDFGVGKDGRRRRVERGEMVAVFNRRNTDKYGATALGNLVDSINKGTFEQEYLGVFGGASGGNGVIVMNSFPSSVSDDISAIRKSTESQRYSAGNGTYVEKYRNRTRIIHLN